ncbi:MAG: IreB family regulatory phosphoprotein [Tissierellia bacterium]|nr:IreB family regulatory phosphoprotein [Tissierellia bacterium]
MNNHTQRFNNQDLKSQATREVLNKVYKALVDKGYNPINQLVGYLISGDPTYITSHNDARIIIKQVDRDEVLEVLLKNFLEDNE